jgi:hypothetical protein
MLGQYTLAVGVEFFRKDADGLLLNVVGFGKGEGIEAPRFGITWIVTYAEPPTRAK